METRPVMRQKSKHEELKQTIVDIFSSTNDKLTTDMLAKKVSSKVMAYNGAPSETVKRAITRGISSLMKDYPGSFGFYLGGDPIFYTMKQDDIYEEFGAGISRRNRKYYMAENTGVQSFEQAMYELLQGHLGHKEIKKLLEGLTLSEDFSIKPAHQLYYDLVSRTEIAPRYQPLYPPEIEERFFWNIITALLHEVSFTARYLQGTEVEYWPVRLVVQGHVMYVVCKTDKHENQYQEYALHRFTDVDNDLVTASEESLQDLQETNLDITYDRECIKDDWKRPIEPDQEHPVIKELELKFYGSPAQHMSEVKFHFDEKTIENQTVCLGKIPSKPGEKADYCHIKTRNIKNDYNLKTWLLGFGSQVEVVEPRWLKDDIKSELENALKHYSN
jgi:hypothetical protein